ncbi:MAG: DUF5665 domain-containing protein [Patescibacteria group bacterium]|nr:DUF5665 domain-containing protein [Patescibacteria group bacterium]
MVPLKKKPEAGEKHIVALTRAVDKAYGSWRHLIARSFVSGVFVGLGATVGFALVIALVGYILGALEVVPIIGEFFANLNEFVNTAAALK